MEMSGLGKTTFYRALNRLAAGGCVVNTGTRKRPHWELPSTPCVLAAIRNETATTEGNQP